MKITIKIFLVLSLYSFASQSSAQLPDIEEGDIRIGLEVITDDLASPVFALAEPGGDDNTLLVVEQRGTVQRIDLLTGSKELFLDFRSQVVHDFGGFFGGFDERGLIGFTFGPNYIDDGKIYTYISKDKYNLIEVDGSMVEDFENPIREADYSTLELGQVADSQAVISEWVVANGALVANSEREFLVIDEPQFNHNGGSINFGPQGYLFIAFGDGGGANDNEPGHGPSGNGSDNTNPLGAILRISPEGDNSPNGRYGIPQSNPFIGQAGLDEIFVYGLRNPYRFSIEELPGRDFNLYVGDVGQDAIEEINRINSSDAGNNYGWNEKEGSFFFNIDETTGEPFLTEQAIGPVANNLVDPTAEYDHDDGVSAISGHVYKGGAINGLEDLYVFGDYSRSFFQPAGRIFYLTESDEIREFQYDSDDAYYLTGFGQDSQGELYILTNPSFIVNQDTGGTLRKIVPGTAVEEEACYIIPTADEKLINFCL